MKTIQTKNVVFITGAFVSNSGWDDWKTYFESKGYNTIAPPWLYKDAPAAELRKRHPDPQLASLTISQLVDYHADIIKKLPEKPILIGHSFGGLLVQLLLQRGLGAAGVAIHSVPPAGVLAFAPSFFKATWGPLGFFTPVNKTFMMSFPQWQYAFTNGMPLEEQKASYEKYTIPESKRVARGGLSSAAKIDFSKPHAPLLMMSGSEDNIMPASLNYANFKKYKQNNGSITEFKLNKGRNHYVLGLPTWREDADYILDWLDKH